MSKPQFEYYDWSKNGYPVLYKGVERPMCNIVAVDTTSNDPKI